MRENKIVIKNVEYGRMSLQELAEKWTELFAHHQHAQNIVARSGVPTVPSQPVQRRDRASTSSESDDGGTR